jgi:hypothetical protein
VRMLIRFIWFGILTTGELFVCVCVCVCVWGGDNESLGSKKIFWMSHLAELLLTFRGLCYQWDQKFNQCKLNSKVFHKTTRDSYCLELNFCGNSILSFIDPHQGIFIS